MDANKQVFIVVATRNASGVAEKIIESEVANYQLKDDTWFMVFAGTARELADKIGVRGQGEIGSGIVAPILNYSGRAAPDLWEWFKVNWPTDG